MTAPSTPSAPGWTRGPPRLSVQIQRGEPKHRSPLSDSTASRGYAAEEFHTPQKRAGASEHRTESLLDLLDGSLVLIASWEPAGQSLAHSRRPREGRRRG